MDERRVDDLAQPVGRPRGHHEVEVEGRVQLVGAEIRGHRRRALGPHLADEDPRRLVRVRDPAPGTPHVVHPGTVPLRQTAVGHGRPGHARGATTLVGVAGRLDQGRRDVDPEPVETPVEPEAQDVLELGTHRRVLPVQVRLARVEQVEVPGTGRPAHRVGDRVPGRPAEDRAPVVGGLFAVRSPARDRVEQGPLGRARRGPQRGPEPRVLVRDVVGHDVGDDPQAHVMRLPDQRLRIRKVAEQRVDPPEVGDVVAAVLLGREVPRADPDRVHTQVGEVREPAADAGDVADPVTARVREGPWIDLVDDGIAPPRRGHRALPPRRAWSPSGTRSQPRAPS